MQQLLLLQVSSTLSLLASEAHQRHQVFLHHISMSSGDQLIPINAKAAGVKLCPITPKFCFLRKYPPGYTICACLTPKTKAYTLFQVLKLCQPQCCLCPLYCHRFEEHKVTTITHVNLTACCPQIMTNMLFASSDCNRTLCSCLLTCQLAMM